MSKAPWTVLSLRSSHARPAQRRQTSSCCQAGRCERARVDGAGAIGLSAGPVVATESFYSFLTTQTFKVAVTPWDSFTGTSERPRDLSGSARTSFLGSTATPFSL
jgi:hypothetical protein